jgi:ribosomal protein L37AE/L43A
MKEQKLWKSIFCKLCDKLTWHKLNFNLFKCSLCGEYNSEGEEVNSSGMS